MSYTHNAGTVAGNTSLKTSKQNTQQTITIVTRKASSQSSSGFPLLHIVDNECSDDELLFCKCSQTPVNQPALVICIVNEQHIVIKIDTGMYLI